MKNKLMLGWWRFVIDLPPGLLVKQMKRQKKKLAREQSFMTPQHRAVHHFVVRELPGRGRPMPPETPAQGLGLSVEDVRRIYEDLEKHMTYLFRNEQGEVTWAYPVTVEPTPHRVTFESGETIYAA